MLRGMAETCTEPAASALVLDDAGRAACPLANGFARDRPAAVALGTDRLGALGGSEPLAQKLRAVHAALAAPFPFVARIAVAVFDPRNATLKTYLHSSGDDDPLPHYQVALADAPSLARLIAGREVRVVNDLALFAHGTREHTRRILGQGYRASLTLPMVANDVFFGFVFFNSYRAGVFTPRVAGDLGLYGHLLTLLVVGELGALRALVATVTSAVELVNARDPEGSGHLHRIAAYARVVAAALARRRDLGDAFVEQVFEFAPLHDIGKIGLADEILFKPGPLDDAEWRVMRTHPERGLAVVDGVLARAGLARMAGVPVLRNVVLFHHEHVDGSGYPWGLAGDAIPLEARIVAVADVLDALTSSRPYKPAWPMAAALAELELRAGSHLDRACVDALLGERAALDAIQARFGGERTP